ncbi:single-stranded DNA-binding protein [Bradyrhizobium pachyrhizi]|uniref:single-stranded DNA-binding protein n=1 Tax=Bradyrhizobium pachyrhizi TaxID=280333 RepID=UPI0024B19BB9|nr:single-stranded DNA-binding protein [Bradyrhizobium pachyrhizi]WFU52206.1 single-stranded DNA-binding protein [Bradyrhizobium pachyrhizi]
MSVNKVIIMGRLGKDPEIRRTQNGAEVCNLSVATSERWKDKRDGEMKEKTEWHNVIVWNENTIKFIDKNVAKGDQVYLQGKLQTRKWQDQSGNDKYSTEIVVPQFAQTEDFQKIWERNGDGGSSRGNDRDDRGGNDRGDDRGSRSSSRDDRNDDRGGSRGSSGRSNRDDDRGGRNDRDRGGNSRAAPSRASDNMDDDIPF